MDYKKKSQVLVLVFLVILIIMSLTIIQKSFDVKSRYNELKTEASMYESLPNKILLLQKKNNYYDSLLTHYKISQTSLQNNLLQSIKDFSENATLDITDFKAPHSVTKNRNIFKTYQFAVQGSFRDILELTYYLEQKTKYGEIAHLKFDRLTDYKTNRISLVCSFGMQMVE